MPVEKFFASLDLGQNPSFPKTSLTLRLFKTVVVLIFRSTRLPEKIAPAAANPEPNGESS
jgi:hypothetical protein